MRKICRLSILWSFFPSLVIGPLCASAGENILFSSDYAECQKQPSPKCLTEIAVKAIPPFASFPRSFRFYSYAEFASSLAYLGQAEFVRQHFNPDYLKLPNLQGKNFAKAVFVDAAIKNPNRLPVFTGRKNDFLLAAASLIYPHPFYGGGAVHVVQAEKSAFHRLPPRRVTPALSAIFSVGQINLTSTEPIDVRSVWPHLLFLMGRPTEAGRAYRRIAELGVTVLPTLSLVRLVQKGEADSAIYAATRIEDVKFRAGSLVKVSEALLVRNEQKRSHEVLRVAINLLPEMTEHNRVKILPTVILILHRLGKVDEAKTLADHLWKLANRSVIDKPWRQFLAAKAYQNIHSDKQAMIVHDHAMAAIDELRVRPSWKVDLYQKSSIMLCQLGQFDRSIKAVTKLKNSRREFFAGDLFNCLKKKLKAKMTPELLANKLDLSSPFSIYLKKASFEIVEGDQVAAIKSLRRILPIEWPDISTLGNLSNNNPIMDLLRLSVAVRDSDLMRSILSRIMAEAKERKPLHIDLAKWFVASAAVVKNQI